MESKTLVPGLYILTKDVSNPKPDRRHTWDWRKWAVWEKGMKIVVRPVQVVDPEIKGEFFQVYHNHQGNSFVLGPTRRSLAPPSELVEAMLKIEPVTLEDFLAESGDGTTVAWAMEKAVRQLIKEGALSIQDVIGALKRRAEQSAQDLMNRIDAKKGE
jgi:hypothetical protein